MRAPSQPTLATAGLLALAGLTLGGCSAERAIVAPAEPDWSYHTDAEQLSNNDAWEKMIPATTLVVDESKVASVEDATR